MNHGHQPLSSAPDSSMLNVNMNGVNGADDINDGEEDKKDGDASASGQLYAQKPDFEVYEDLP